MNPKRIIGKQQGRHKYKHNQENNEIVLIIQTNNTLNTIQHLPVFVVLKKGIITEFFTPLCIVVLLSGVSFNLLCFAQQVLTVGRQLYHFKGKYLSMMYFVRLSVCVAVYMSVQLFVYYLWINCTCVFVYVCYSLLEQVY